jgi:hypothetical protein
VLGGDGNASVDPLLQVLQGGLEDSQKLAAGVYELGGEEISAQEVDDSTQDDVLELLVVVLSGILKN